MKRNIFKVGAFLLIVLFFTAPLLQCKGNSSVSATGWQLSTGSGSLMEKSKDGPAVVVFIMLLVPLGLLIFAFTKKSFTWLRNLSIGSLLLEIIFLILLHSEVNSSEAKGSLEVTVFNWLILFLYIGMVVVAQLGIQKE